MQAVGIWDIVGNTRRDCGRDMVTSYTAPREWSRAKAGKKAS
jgi:hypothetical protein